MYSHIETGSHEHVTDSQYLDPMTRIHQADFMISKIQVGKNNKHIYFCS